MDVQVSNLCNNERYSHWYKNQVWHLDKTNLSCKDKHCPFSFFKSALHLQIWKPCKILKSSFMASLFWLNFPWIRIQYFMDQHIFNVISSSKFRWLKYNWQCTTENSFFLILSLKLVRLRVNTSLCLFAISYFFNKSKHFWIRCILPVR